MNDALLIQCTKDAEYARMIGLYFDRHAEYCYQHAIDYWVHCGPVRFSDHQSWDKFVLASQAFLTGYQYVIYLDADAFVFDTNCDLRDACIRPLNLVRWNVPLNHLQAGAIYFNNADGTAKELCRVLIEEAKYYLEIKTSLRGWYEQGLINELYKIESNRRFIGEIPLAWNWCSEHCDFIDHPFVISWHGVDEPGRTQSMRKALGK